MICDLGTDGCCNISYMLKTHMFWAATSMLKWKAIMVPLDKDMVHCFGDVNELAWPILWVDWRCCFLKQILIY